MPKRIEFKFDTTCRRTQRDDTAPALIDHPPKIKTKQFRSEMETSNASSQPPRKRWPVTFINDRPDGPHDRKIRRLTSVFSTKNARDTANYVRTTKMNYRTMRFFTLHAYLTPIQSGFFFFPTITVFNSGFISYCPVGRRYESSKVSDTIRS